MAKTTFSKHLRVGRPGAPAHARRKRDACSSGGFYSSPVTGQTLDSSQPLNITWDPSCLSTSAADIYLFNPGSESAVVHMWHNVNFGLGNYEATLDPSWWNGTASVSLQLTIMPLNMPIWQNPLPAGPVFTATYSGPAVASDVSGAASENVNNFSKHGMSKGAIAAAVILPLLAVIGLGVAAYIKLSRAKGKDKRKTWSEGVDKRMSTISADWKSVTPAGATAAIRNSMAVGNRDSFSFGGIRPSSTVALEGGQAGIGARGLGSQEGGEDVPQMSQLRTGVRTSAFGERVSRVSFAADTRPSGEYRRTRAFQNNFVVPAVPELDVGEPGAMSPTQASGPLSLTAEDINARMSGQQPGRPSMDEYLPALSMMRTGDEAAGNDDMLFNGPSMPTPPSPTHQVPKSPIMGAMPMQPMPANVMSPDEMLRAYAERRAVAPGAGTTMMTGPSLPAPVANYNGNGMRTLYAPTSHDSSTPSVPSNLRKSMAPTENSHYDEGDEDAYVGTAE